MSRVIGRVGARGIADLLQDWHSGRPSSRGLHRAVRRLVLDGRLPPGTRLPAEREFAEALGVSRTLVVRALELLREEGFAASRQGSGSWVRLPGDRANPDPGGWPPATGEFINLAQATLPAPPELTTALDRARCLLPEHLSGHGYQAFGLPELRELIAASYARRGLPTNPQQILVTNGAQHGFALVLRALVSPGERVLVEHPTYPNPLQAIRGVGAEAVAVPMLAQGWDLELMSATLHQANPKLAYLIPDFQNPTGIRMGADGRERLAGMLRRTRTPAVIDETLVDLDLTDGEAPAPVAAFDEGRVITLGSAGKSFWGGLRLGWVRAPEDLVQRLLLDRAAVDLGSPVLEQLLLTELLRDPDPVLRRRREEVARLRDVLIAELAEHLPGWRFRVPDGGLSLWCDLGSPVSSRLVVAAEQHGLRLVPGSRFAVQGSLERYLRFPYTLPVDELRQSVRRIAAVAAPLGGTTSPCPLDVPVN
ncbi:PLP-dependent aminotransferase family protein [Saccharopolyspora sp. HNM0986]|uniref:MocR-like transcription factor YczR n=1 Tax=Saccharopolyspora galaxeae TaxID=2781241 RepID=UPI00190D4BDF|nr:PLP-dependent aminotransferase family protein [Saccharopolyspora sp. HNM0986]MBK0866180.1 PLP-dependent aminotransferase family protein [Saccharopolyspora sp. HNM0986]